MVLRGLSGFKLRFVMSGHWYFPFLHPQEPIGKGAALCFSLALGARSASWSAEGLSVSVISWSSAHIWTSLDPVRPSMRERSAKESLWYVT